MRCTIILFSIFAVARSQSHDLMFGQPAYGDIVVFKTYEYKMGIPLMVRTSIIEYPKPGQSNFAVIRAIHIKDNNKDGSGGYSTISSGGIGQRYAKIKLKSQRGSGFNFTVTIYGRF